MFGECFRLVFVVLIAHLNEKDLAFEKLDVSLSALAINLGTANITFLFGNISNSFTLR